MSLKFNSLMWLPISTGSVFSADAEETRPIVRKRTSIKHVKLRERMRSAFHKEFCPEFRTTVVPGLVEIPDISEIGKWLSGSKKFVIQQFRNSREMLDKGLKTTIPYSRQELEEMAKIAKPYFNEVEIR